MTSLKNPGKKNRTINRRTLVAGATAASGAMLVGAKSQAYAAPMLNFRQEPVTIEFWGGEPEESGPGALVAAFNELDPGIQAKYTRYVNDDTGNTQLDTALQGGANIDIYQSYGIPRTSKRIEAGAGLDLTAYIDANPEIKEWADSEQLFTYNDAYFSLPCVRDPTLVITNAKLLEDAGVTLPETWTVAEFRELAGQLTGNFAYGTFAPQDTDIQVLGPNRWWKEGGQESNFDDPAFQTAWETHRGMIDEGSAFPWTDVLARNLRVYQQNIFLTEQCAFWCIGAWVLRYVNDKDAFPHNFVTTFTSVPTPDGVDDPWYPGTVDNNILINPASEKQDAAWEFLKFRLIDGAEHYLASGKAPAFPGMATEDVVAGILGPDRDELYDVAAFERVITNPDIRIPTDSITTASAEIQQVVQQQVDQYLIGEIDIDQCVSEVKRQSDEAIAAASA